jgi:hypothetical protein
MDGLSKLDELKSLLEQQGVNISDGEEDGRECSPTTKISAAALGQLRMPGENASVWVSWSRKVKQISAT